MLSAVLVLEVEGQWFASCLNEALFNSVTEFVLAFTNDGELLPMVALFLIMLVVTTFWGLFKASRLRMIWAPGKSRGMIVTNRAGIWRCGNEPVSPVEKLEQRWR